ncbi:MAG: DoxX family protein [Bacteroidetes bacterium]|nr:DoxX family protein [Bacteroidota bacterium]MBS1630533.1 DoxX family protein [Bacteroidota bacterium]
MAVFGSLSRFQNFGFLLLRIGIGAIMIGHGFPKLKGGPELWEQIGHAMSQFGIHDFYTFWGFSAGFAEAVGGLLFLLGFLFRPACLLMLFVMIAASLQSYGMGGWSALLHPLSLGVLFVSMFIIGPGRFSVDKR